MRKKGVRLSQCMIVKNEEDNIERALSWGKDILHEQIVVDTGSTDCTVELARAMGARVYHFDWIDDFAAAKNFAISKASGDWIAFLDADEYMPPEDVGRLLPLLDKLDKTRYHVMLTSWMQAEEDGKIFAGGAQTRIFRNMEGLRFRNRIHEELAVNGENIFRYTVDATEELMIIHTGYSHEASGEGQKGARNARLIHMELEEHPDNYDMMGYLGDSYYAMGDYEEAAKWYRKSISLMPERIEAFDVRSAITFWKLMALVYKQDEEEELMGLYRKASALIPKECDYDYIAGKYYVGKKDFRKGAYYLEQAILKLEQYGHVGGGELLTGSLQGAWELLALCYYQIGELAPCVKYCTCLLKADPYLMSTLVMLMCAFHWDEERNRGQAAKAPEVARFLESLYDWNCLKDRVFMLRAAMKADYRELVGVIRDAFSETELEYLDQLMEQKNSAV